MANPEFPPFHLSEIRPRAYLSSPPLYEGGGGDGGGLKGYI